MRSTGTGRLFLGKGRRTTSSNRRHPSGARSESHRGPRRGCSAAVVSARRSRHLAAHERRAESMFITLHVAAVTAADGIRFVVAEPTADLLALRLSEYVRSRAPYALWPEDALCVERALAAGRGAAAVDAYFAKVGRRWDQEFVIRASVHVDLPCARASTRL